MIASPNIIKYNKLKEQYKKLSNFIRSLRYHYTVDGCTRVGQVFREIEKMERRIDLIITEMNAFEQIDLEEYNG